MICVQGGSSAHDIKTRARLYAQGSNFSAIAAAAYVRTKFARAPGPQSDLSAAPRSARGAPFERSSYGRGAEAPERVARSSWIRRKFT